MFPHGLSDFLLTRVPAGKFSPWGAEKSYHEIFEYNKVAGTDRGISVRGIISVQDEGAIVQILLIEVTARDKGGAVELTVIGEQGRGHRCRV